MPSRKRDPHASQLTLFANPAPVTAPAPDPMEAVYTEAADLAAKLPPRVYFGTSSWSFPGWQGIVYPRRASESALSREGLRDYARHPLLRTVGIDRGYYAPIPPADLERYATQLPPGFRCCAKAPERVTAPVHLGHGRGQKGEINPDFLSADVFMETMGQPFAEHFADHAGPFVFEFPPVPAAHRLAPGDFLDRLDRFLSKLPRDGMYAIELRERSYLIPEYSELLAAHRVAHTYNYWTAMPMPGAQRANVPVNNGPFAVVRLLLRPHTRYDERKNEFAPFDKLVDPDPAMRRDVVDIIREAVASGLMTFVLVNNKAEGSAPLTIRALAELLAQHV